MPLSASAGNILYGWEPKSQETIRNRDVKDKSRKKGGKSIGGREARVVKERRNFEKNLFFRAKSTERGPKRGRGLTCSYYLRAAKESRGNLQSPSE